MKKITAILITVMALVALTACGDYTKTADSHETTDSHDVTTTNTTQPTDTNTSTDVNTSTSIDSNSTLEVPTFNGNSQGKIVVQCEDDIAYFIMAYDCLKPDTKVGTTVDKGTVVIDERLHIGEVFHVKGHVERTGAITITGTVFSGGKDLPTNTAWVGKCN